MTPAELQAIRAHDARDRKSAGLWTEACSERRALLAEVDRLREIVASLPIPQLRSIEGMTVPFDDTYYNWYKDNFPNGKRNLR